MVHQTRFPHATVTQYDHLKAKSCKQRSKAVLLGAQRKLTFNKTFFRNDMAGDKSRYGRRKVSDGRCARIKSS